MSEKQSCVEYSCACDPGEEMDFRGIVEHIKQEHGEEIEGKPVQMEMVNHIDAETWHSTTNKVTTSGGNVFYQQVVCGR